MRVCHRKALCSLSVHATMARQRVSVYIIKALCAHHCFMYQRQDWIFCIYYKETLCLPLLHVSVARPQVSIHIRKSSRLVVAAFRKCNFYCH